MLFRSALVSFAWVLWRIVPAAHGAYPLGLEPIYAGLATSLSVALLTRPRSPKTFA